MSDVSTNDLQKLRSCPFCGGEVKISTYRNEGYQIECPNHEWPKRGMWGEKRPESDIAADIGMFTWGISDEAKEALIDAWNTRADDVPEHPVDKAQADSREQLEADIAEWCNNDSGEISALKRWLDRQDAITRREFESECEFCQSEVARLQEQMDNLTAERDELQSIIDHMPRTEQECEACQEAHDRLMFNAKLHQDELREQLAEKQRVCDIQRDSFLKLEREYRELQDVCGELERTIENMRGME